MSVARYKYLTWIFGVLSGVLLVLFAHIQGELNLTKTDIRHAHERVRIFQNIRSAALKSGVTEAAYCLETLNTPSEEYRLLSSGLLSSFVEREHDRAIQDIIAYLRSKTGRDLGDKPEAWIQEFGKK